VIGEENERSSRDIGSRRAIPARDCSLVESGRLVEYTGGSTTPGGC
jgi:hypothetical protein